MKISKLLKDVRALWIELHGDAYYDCNGGQDLDKAIELLDERDERIAKLVKFCREFIKFIADDYKAGQ
jgi:hypothetical protein